MILGKCTVCALVVALVFMACMEEYWDTLNFENCELRYPELPQTPFDKQLFAVERMPPSACINSKNLRQISYDRKGLPVNLRVLQLTALESMSSESLQSFYSEYYDWIDAYTMKGGILLLKNFTTALVDREHLGSGLGNIEFQNEKLPPSYIPFPAHSHIMPYPVVIRGIQQTASKRLGHTVFYNLPDALKMLTPEDRDSLQKYLSKDYSIPFITVPHDFVSCEYHNCTNGQVKVSQTMVNESDILQGFAMIPHIWFKKGGYAAHMLRVGLLTIPSNFVRTLLSSMFMRAVCSLILANASSAINEPFEMKLYDALWLTSVGIMINPEDMVISNTWVSPHARLPSAEGKKLRAVEYFPCDSIDKRTQCGTNFQFEDLEALARKKMDYTEALGKQPVIFQTVRKFFFGFFEFVPISTWLY